MKILLSLAVLVVATSALDQEFYEQMKQKMREQVADCAKEVSASPDEVSNILDGHKLPESHEGKCIFFCMHKIYNAQNEDGTLNMAGALSNLEIVKDMDLDLYNKVYATFKKCESTPFNSDPCIYATNIVACVAQEAIAQGLKEAVIA